MCFGHLSKESEIPIKCNSEFAYNVTCKKQKKKFSAFTHDEHQSINVREMIDVLSSDEILLL